MDTLSGKGVRLIARKPDSPEINAELSKENGLDYDIVFDYQNKVSHKFDIVAPVANSVIEKYWVNIQKTFTKIYANGFELPIPATYIIDKNKTIVYSYVESDFTARIHPSELTKVLTVKEHY